MANYKFFILKLTFTDGIFTTTYIIFRSRQSQTFEVIKICQLIKLIKIFLNIMLV